MVVWVMCPACVPFFVLAHRWFAPIYVVDVVDPVLMYFDTYADLLPHILAWIYQLWIFGNTTLV